MRCLIILLVCLFAAAFAAEDKCQKLGEKCDRTVFNRCCENLTCVLTGFADGTCQKCLPQGHFCFNDSECCGGDCAWYFFCK